MKEKITVIFQKITRLYEQGAAKERVGAYLRRWLRRAGTLGIIGALAGNRMGVIRGRVYTLDNLTNIRDVVKS